MTAHIYTKTPSKGKVIDRNKRENKIFLYTDVHSFFFLLNETE